LIPESDIFKDRDKVKSRMLENMHPSVKYQRCGYSFKLWGSFLQCKYYQGHTGQHKI